MSNPFEKGGNDRQRAMVRELSNARKQFAQAFAAGQAPVLDRFGRALEVGSLIVWHPPHDLVFQVDDIVPVMDPNQAPGYIRVLVSISAPVTWPARQAAPDIIVVGSTKDQHAVLDATVPWGSGLATPAAEPPPTPGENPDSATVPGDRPADLPPVDAPTGGEGNEPGSGT